MKNHISRSLLQRGYSSFGRRFWLATMTTTIAAVTSAQAEPDRILAEEIELAQFGGGLGAFGDLGDAIRKKTEEAMKEIEGLGVPDCDHRSSDGNCAAVSADGSNNGTGSGGLQPQTPIPVGGLIFRPNDESDNPEIRRWRH